MGYCFGKKSPMLLLVLTAPHPSM